MSRISPQDRALIDAALARTTPEERRVPTGVSALHVDYVWRNNKLEAVDPERAGWRRKRYVLSARAPRRAPWSLTAEQRQAIKADLAVGASYSEIWPDMGSVIRPSPTLRTVQRRAGRGRLIKRLFLPCWMRV